MKKIKILLFDNIELLDFAGPLEVFSVVDYLDKTMGIEVTTAGFGSTITVAKSGLKVTPDETINDEATDLLIIPGGLGSRYILTDDDQLAQIDSAIKNAKIVASVCTGALILAKLGYLKERTAITHRGGIKELEEIDGSIKIDRSKRFIDNGNVLTAAGISAGIDMSLYLVEKYHGSDLKEKVQYYMEYKS